MTQAKNFNANTIDPTPNSTTDKIPAEKKGGFPVGKLVGLIILVGAGALLYSQFGDYLKLSYLAERESQLRELQVKFPAMTIAAAYLIYVTITGLSLPGAAILTLLYGWYFGFSTGALVVSFASTSGATVAFLMSRYVLRDWVQEKFASKLKTVNESFANEGAFYLFTLRLIPAVPFFVINVVTGLTKLPVWTYWWVSQLGMLPGTLAYVYAGSTVPNLKTLAEKGAGGIISPQLLIAFVILGLLPIVLKKIVEKVKR